jgi:predicted nucleic acid-binding Zn ribbon protein
VTVASTLDRLLADRGWSRSLSVAGVIGRWRAVVGDQLADHCQPETFEEGALVVRADSTAWAMQVRLLIPQLSRRLDEEIGEGLVESITVLGPGGPTWKRGPRSVPGRGPRDTYG